MTLPLKILLLSVTAIYIVACSGEKQNTRTQMQEREIFLIAHSYPEEMCMSQKLKDTLQKETGLINMLMSSTDNSVNCAYFSRTSATCVKFSFTEKYPDACVIASDRPVDKKTKRMNAKDIADTMIELLEK
ncbi:hypothetical protein [Sulfurovum sp.]|uniref:hypothetical protein n=1 Tax=Sulfurovum sp. TaxID=1969726 RepID=UPI002867C687|nr:hypothetical protein [Sulfurovum sp.]